MKMNFDEQSKTLSISMNAKEKRRWYRARGALSRTLGRPASNEDLIIAALAEAIARLETEQKT